MEKQKSVSDLMAVCDDVIDNCKGVDGNPTIDDLKVKLNAVGKKQKLISLQLEYSKLAGVKINSKDFDFVYKPTK